MAQSTGTIAGAAKDTTGAVLPGVTVEAASPALIEKVRTVTTDSAGEYKIVDLRPGTYSVTFTLTGFGTVKREQLTLNSGVTLQVNADMKVGSIEETITVSGASPVVDTQNVRGQTVLTREVLDALPNAKNPQGLITLTVGAVAANRPGARDVGGTKGEDVSPGTLHGGSNSLKMVDGMYLGSTNFPAYVRHPFNQLDVEEIVVESTGLSAESLNGLNFNMISKSGGNRFSVVFNGEYAGSALQSPNLSDDLKARGLASANELRKVRDVGFSVGGPLKRDRLWFFTAHRWWGGEEYVADLFYNKNPNPLLFTPDPTRQAFSEDYARDNTGRVTWQATTKQRLAFTASVGNWCHCMYDSGGGGFGVITAPEARVDLHVDPSHLVMATWTYPATSRLLFSASFNSIGEHQRDKPTRGSVAGARALRDLGTGVRYGSFMADSASWSDTYGDMGEQGNRSVQVLASYVTGSHAFKFGIRNAWGTARLGTPEGISSNFPDYYYLRNGVPVQIGQKAQPHYSRADMKSELGFFAQDQWTVKRLTLNLGVRYDRLHTIVPAGTRPGGIYAPSFSYSEVDCTPCWNDISPRLGAAYDLFGNGKTAVKAFLGKFLVVSRAELSNAVNPALSFASFVTRTWNDLNTDFVPNCDLTNRGANGECGAVSDSRFGQPVPVTKFAKDVTEGWGLRPHYWQGSVGIQHELMPGIGVSAAYFRTSYGNNFNLNNPARDNLRVTPEDFDPYCVTAPSDTRLRGGGGYQVCGLYDVKPAKFGQVDNIVTRSAYVDNTQVYNGMQLTVSARKDRWLVSGGFSTGQTEIDNCHVPDAPPQFCKTTLPFMGQTQIKFLGTFPIPGGVVGSVTVLSLPGFIRSANMAFTNAQIAPSLGRNLAACGAAVVCNAAVTIRLDEPNSLYEPRQNQVDLRFGRPFRAGKVRVEPSLYVYNLFNAASVLNLNGTYGAAWLRPSDILTARFAKLGARITF
jgi:hypothetical protein